MKTIKLTNAEVDYLESMLRYHKHYFDDPSPNQATKKVVKRLLHQQIKAENKMIEQIIKKLER